MLCYNERGNCYNKGKFYVLMSDVIIRIKENFMF